MSDSVAADGQGQLPQWVVDRARAEIDNGNTVFAASHHPAVTRGSVDRTFIDLLHTLYSTELYLDKFYRIYTDDPVQAAANLGLKDKSCILGGAGALADAGVKYIFTGHGGAMSISEVTTTNGADMFDVMTGSLVNASAGVRFATLSKGVNNMKEQRAEFSADMVTSAEGVESVEAAAHAALKKQMVTEVDYAINTAEKVIAYLIPAIKPNIQQLVRDIDLAVLVPDMAGLFNLLGGTISSVKNDLAAQYVGPLFDILGNSAKLHNIIVDIRSALEKMDFNGQDLYGFLTDVFIAIQKGDGKTPPSVEGFFAALRNQEPNACRRYQLLR